MRPSSRQLPLLLFATVAALAAVIVAAFLLPAEPHGRILWLGWAAGVLEILLFAGLVALGVRRGGGLRGLGVPLACGTAAYIAVWTWLVVAYRGYQSDPSPALFLALPAPTAIMLYVLWPMPLVFVIFFVAGFRRWVLTEDDEAEFERLVARRRARESEPE